jgi:hypothetical protein
MRLVAAKVSVTLIVIVAFVAGLTVISLTSGKTPTTTAAKFMGALEDGDYKTLASLSYAEGVSQKELESQWEYTMTVAAEHFVFSYNIKSETMPGKDQAVVRMDYTKDAGSGSSYPELFDLPMIKTEDGWKVLVYEMNREMFPGLPRG